MEFSKPVPYAEAIAKLRRRVAVASALDTHDWQFGMPLAIRERALWSATIENARFMQRLSEALDDYLTGATETIHTPDGRVVQQRKVGNKAEFVQIMRRFAVAEGMGPLGPKDADTLKDITSSPRLALIFDVQVTSAREYGRWKQGQQQDVLQHFPAYRFVREVDVTAPRPLHEEFEFAVRLKSDLPFWLNMNNPSIGGFGVPWGPWGFNSGMGVEEVPRDEAEELGLLNPGDVVRPVEQNFNDYLEAGATGLDPEQLAWIKSKLGDLVRIDGDRIVFVDPRDRASSPPSPQPKPAPQVKLPAPSPAPAGVPVSVTPEEPPTPDRASVAKAIVIEAGSKPGHNQKVNALKDALLAIDAIHDDGILPKIPFRVGPTKGATAWFMQQTNAFTGESQAVELRIKSTARRPITTMLHEIGHFLDFGAFGTRRDGRNGYGSFQDKELAPVMAAIRASESFAAILANSKYSFQAKQYLLRPSELFARAYMQWIASQTTNGKIAAEFADHIRDQNAVPQWSESDFGPISAAMTDLFRARGWLKNPSRKP